ncbi:hypothetical protein [Corynebacterium sp. AOP34-BR1-29]|uniref:hypothetical protein n=1 Tax=Corynebacterium sp. AOP34-BR1-29 TaxID=3457688 RepID=UPI0040342B7D
MPDQTPVTDDDRRTAYEWAASLDPDMRCWTDRERAAARVILATVPAPPATLADEIREEGAGRPPGAVKRVNALADRVEAIEKARDKAQQDAVDAWEHAAQTDREHVRIMELREQDYVRVASERDEARTKVEEVEGHLSKSWRQRDAKDVELERLSREREQQEKALVEHGRLLAEARAAFDEVENRNLNLEADLRESHAEVERLTVSLNRQCTTVTPSVHNTDVLTASSDTLPDPADVPTNEPWEVVGPNGPAIGYRDGHEDLPWSVVHKDGNGCDDLSDGRVTLVARLVRRLVGPVEVVEE